jgi:mono/diheme cytochrome c family protein
MPVPYAETNRRLFWASSAGLLPFVLLLWLPLRVRAQSDGKTLFKAKCAVCHGENGDANSIVGRGMKLQDIRSNDVQKYTDAGLATIVHCGKGKMPGYEGQLNDDQITQLVSYMRTLAANKHP